MTTLFRVLRAAAEELRCARLDIIQEMRRHDQSVGAAAWDVWRTLHRYGEPSEALTNLDGWPTCSCTACGCTAPASATDDSGQPTCAECAEYTTDADGDIHCARCADVEIVTESCGAGNQTRSYPRLRPPSMPESDPAGEWACCWDTVGDDAHVVSRHATREAAEQACAAHDWPPPGDHTQYLCGYVAQHLTRSRD